MYPICHGVIEWTRLFSKLFHKIPAESFACPPPWPAMTTRSRVASSPPHDALRDDGVRHCWSEGSLHPEVGGEDGHPDKEQQINFIIKCKTQRHPAPIGGRMPPLFCFWNGKGVAISSQKQPSNSPVFSSAAHLHTMVRMYGKWSAMSAPLFSPSANNFYWRRNSSLCPHRRYAWVRVTHP